MVSVWERKSALVILLGLLVLSVSLADIAISPVKNIDTIGYPGEILTYQVTIYNVGGTEERISLFGAEFEDARTGGQFNQLTINPGDSKDILIRYQIPAGFKPGSISPQISVFDKNGVQFTSIQLQGTVLPIPPTYSTTTISEALLLQNGVVQPIDPREPFELQLIVFSPGPVTVPGLTITSQFTLDYQRAVRVEEGTSTITISNLRIPADTVPDQYPFTVSLSMPDGTTPTKATALLVKGYSECLVSEETSVGIFGRTYEATVSNPGTEDRSCNVESSFTTVESGLLTDLSEGATVANGKVSWSFTIRPGESRVLSYGVNYLPLVALPFVVILLGFTFWYFTRKLEIVRELLDYKLYPGFTDLKMQIRVKNLSNQEYRDVVVRDLLPVFVKEVRDFGTLSGKVTKHGKHKVVQWELKDLKPKEERVFNYKVRTTVEILGKMIFPQTTVSFYDEEGKKHDEISGPLVIEIQEVKSKD